MVLSCLTHRIAHGDWHDGSCWDPLTVEALRARGHEAVAPDLPYDDPDAGFEDRARPARAALEGVSGPVVVVGHSASSGYAALMAEATPAQLLVHLCPPLGPFAPPAGAPEAFRRDFPFPAKNAAGVTVWDTEAAIETMYPRLPPETARTLAERLRPRAQRRPSIRCPVIPTPRPR